MEKIFLEPKPVWAETMRVRGAVLNELKQRGFSAETAEMGAMVATELAENAIKYGRYESEGPEDHFTIEIESGQKDITVHVCHPIAAEPDPNLTRLKAMIGWIKKCKDSREAYQERINAIAGRDRKPGEPQRGLGLVRIAYEGQATLSYRFTGGILCISARCDCS